MAVKIAIIEDEKKIARFMELELIHEGYQVDVFKKGSHFLDFLEKNKEFSYDLILLDIMLPEMSGLEVCSYLREYSEVPVIMVTAKDSVF